MLITETAYPRAGLIGNPSDGFYGKTIAFAFTNFRAQVTLFESPELEVQPGLQDRHTFNSTGDLVRHVHKLGYYGGVRLLKAMIVRFADYCHQHGIDLNGRNFTLRYSTDIPTQVGLAGSSAILTASLRALMRFYGVTIPQPEQANLVLSAETQELGIPAGLQDRVAQAYQGVVYMDFDRSLLESRGYGDYVPIAIDKLPPLFIAYCTQFSEGTEVYHSDLKGRFLRGEERVVEAIRYWAGLTVQAREAIEAGDHARLGQLLNANYDRRAAITRLNPGHMEMVETARSVGASAKFSGSGGAIVGTYEDEAMYQRLCERFAANGVTVIKPQIAPAISQG